ncbi:MAG TPA: tetraacyldisaccharide 4'-kinase, partial [Steroidobacteraceae bacterium]|nr:tetraacyldisaccharide 4'-kinase [Steroidobacteraceae bacterium]
MRAWLERVWFGGARGGGWLIPLAFLFGAATTLRRHAYRAGWLSRAHIGRPVVVIGNLTVGGSGKTPLTVWLALQLKARGLSVGIVSRGYGGASRGPLRVEPSTDPRLAGDEPVLLARRTGAPVVVGRDRVAAARLLAGEVDLVIADDGLQHYRLARELEIVVVDGVRRFGNGRLLPAGPLRE